jgi:DNA ligase 4
VSFSPSQHTKDQHALSHEQGNLIQVPFALSTPELNVTIDQKDQKDQSQPTELFKRPFVVEVMGAGFDKPANISYFTL